MSRFDLFLKRLRRHWRGHLEDLYLQGAITAGIVFIALMASLRWDRTSLAGFATSILDGQPWMLFLGAWCVARLLQLASHILFRTGIGQKGVVGRIWRAARDAFLLFFSAFVGAAVALALYGVDTTKNLPAVGIVLLTAIGQPFLFASQCISRKSLGLSRHGRQWVGLAFGTLFFAWMAFFGNFERHKEVPDERLAHASPVLSADHGAARPTLR